MRPQPALEASHLARCRTEPVIERLKQGPLRAYRLLLEVALKIAQQRGYPANVAQVVFHCPLEAVALGLEVHRVTLWRWLGVLRAEGLLDWRPHKTTFRKQTRNDGTLWAVKLCPCGQPARLSAEDLTHPWRDLEADIREGRTAYKQMQQSKEGQLNLKGAELILYWALTQEIQLPPLNMNVAGPDVTCVMGLSYVAVEDRPKAVEQCAKIICAFLGDAHPRFWCSLLWRLLRLADAGQHHFHGLYLMLRRAGADWAEGFARKAGALLVQRLKSSPIWFSLGKGGRSFTPASG